MDSIKIALNNTQKLHLSITDMFGLNTGNIMIKGTNQFEYKNKELDNLLQFYFKKVSDVNRNSKKLSWDVQKRISTITIQNLTILNMDGESVQLYTDYFDCHCFITAKNGMLTFGFVEYSEYEI